MQQYSVPALWLGAKRNRGVLPKRKRLLHEQTLLFFLTELSY